jgi:hypothetical protein
MTSRSRAGSRQGVKEPILVVSDDVDLFHSVRDAERYLEAPEARTGVRVLDAAGRPLRAVVVRKFLAKVVTLEEEPDAPADVPSLRVGLIRLIAGRAQVPEESLVHLPLEELIAHARQHITH